MAVSLQLATTLNWINGEWRHSGVEGESINPATSEKIGRYAQGGVVEADDAIAAAVRAFRDEDWRDNRNLRARVLNLMADRFEAKSEELARLITIENGKTLEQAEAGLWRELEELLNGDDSDTGEIEEVETFINVGSSEIYGDPDPQHVPTPESYRGNISCIGPRACYDESKRLGETLCVVGESGCGKSTIGRVLLGLVPATSGAIVLEGRDIAGLGRAAYRPLRRTIQIVFQDPYASLNPRMRAGEIVAEPLENFGGFSREEREVRAAELFDRVGLPRDAMRRYPFEFSGGQRQRLGIARALALQPEIRGLAERYYDKWESVDLNVEKSAIPLVARNIADAAVIELRYLQSEAAMQEEERRAARESWTARQTQ